MHHATASDAPHATPIPSPNDLLTARDVATMLGVTTDWVYAQSRRRRIPTITLGRYRRYRRRAILEWLETPSRTLTSDPVPNMSGGGPR
jgi:excisionase family DNA binding protein